MSGTTFENNSTAIPWRIFACVALGIIMATLDGSVVTVALPYIREEFGATLPQVKWVMNIYLLVITGLLLIFGRLADIVGQKRVYVTGMVVFTIGSGLCAAAISIETLVAARAAQGIGAAMIMACSPAIITATFPPAMRGKGLGMIGTMVGLGLTAGPPVGGFLLALFGWRSLFLLNLPVGVGALLFSMRYLPKLKFAKGVERFDFVGGGLMMTACALLLVGIDFINHPDKVISIAMIAGAAAFAVFFILWEKRHAQPLVQLEIFKRRGFSFALATSVLSFTSGFSVFFLMPFYLTEVRGFTPGRLGLWLTIMPLMVMVVAPWAGSMSDRIGYRTLTTMGQALRATAFAIFTFAGPDTSLPLLFCGLALFGTGNGLFMSPNASSIMGGVEPRMLGVAGGLTAVARNLGMSLGAAMGATVFMMVQSSQLDFVPAWQSAMRAALTVCLLAMIVSALRGPDIKPAKGS